MRAHHLYLLFYCNSQEKQVSKRIVVEKVTILLSKVNLEHCQTSVMELLCEKSQRLKALTYFWKKLQHRCLTRF